MFQFVSRKAITLDAMDAAIILREDGTIEASFPETPTPHVPGHVLTTAAFVYALSCPDLYDLILERFLKECAPSSLYTPSNDL